MKYLLSATVITLAVGLNAASAQSIPTRNSDHNGPGHAVTNYPYVEGGSYVSLMLTTQASIQAGKTLTANVTTATTVIMVKHLTMTIQAVL